MDLRKLHSVTGAIPLVAFMLFHLWETSHVSGGRLGFVSAQWGSDAAPVSVALEVLLVLFPLAAHAALGVRLALVDRAARDPGSHATYGMRNVQRATGVVALAFLVFHLWQTWAQKLGGVGAAAIYDGLRDELGTPFHLGAYVIGLTCVCFHLGQGVGAAFRTLFPASSDGARRGVRLAAAALAVALWAVSLSTLGHFATGRALLGGGGTSHAPSTGGGS